MQTLFARHRTAIYRWLLRFVGNETVAEDLLSDVFLDVGVRPVGLKGVPPLRLGYFRSPASRRSPRVVADRTGGLDETIEATVADTPEDAAGEEKPGRAGARSINRLSPEHREIIDLVYYHEKSVEECAQILAIPAATVKTRMFYARKKLAELVERA